MLHSSLPIDVEKLYKLVVEMQIVDVVFDRNGSQHELHVECRCLDARLYVEHDLQGKG